MPPDNNPFNPQRILEVLARHQVRCVVIGGYAAVLAGAEIVTRDIDITPATDHANLQRGLHIAIASLDDIIRSKTAAGRAKDLAALPQLHAARERQLRNADRPSDGAS